MLQVGLSTCGFKPIEENFKALKAAGIKNIEISRGWLEYDSLDYDQIKHLADKYDVNIWSFHLPFADTENIDISSLDESIRQKSVELWRRLIKIGAKIGIKIFIAHPSSEPLSEDIDIRSKNIEAAKKSLKELAEFAQEFDATIAVENLPRSCLGRTANEIADLISADEHLKICLDTNHFLIDNNLNLIEKMGDKIITLHVSDYDFIDEKHWLPGEGKIDWHALYNMMVQDGFNGPWLYEISLKSNGKTPCTRDLTFQDVYNNAMEIFQNKPITKI